ncbi:aspartate aminotransferase family protein [Microbulbifer sp. OS29]|uniref:Aspartate aminotransferase family protein n=1 Tax=Microbulbifer okhotskensis TaxID=2926617 RepID=A0A9X2EP16_9GAMM|nr:aspartate aminotransferase family protein [Microbulbifer okhotskensis]MCO1335762.1 aspartate aminotransferase family protein [Microbulbifer okhotskensis]
MNDRSAGLSEAQLSAYWMPYTGNRQFKRDPRIITSASGCYYLSAEGRQIFDGLSGLWTCGAGHNRREIIESIAQQASTLDYAPAFQFGHPKVFALAEQISQLMPEGLNRIFFTNSGSEAAETSLKIARAYWHKRGQPEKTKLIGRSKGYHGVNFGGISVGGISTNRTMFGSALDSDHLNHTLLSENRFSRGQPLKGDYLADELLELIQLHDAANIAALIIEPMAGSAGVLPPPRGYLERLRKICEQHDILLIFDEVITAFGRMGKATGAEYFGVTPDILNTAKQLTNGAVPMGAVAVRQDIYDTFMEKGGPKYQLELPHGYTYSGHPLACAAALATLGILHREKLFERSSELALILENYIHQLKGLPLIEDIRNCGLAAGLTIQAAPSEPLLHPYLIAMKMWHKGFYIRYSGDTLQLGVPFIAREEDLDGVINALAESILEVANGQ